MKKYIGYIKTKIHGSDCLFEFYADESATEEELEELAKEAAFENINWYFKEQP